MKIILALAMGAAIGTAAHHYTQDTSGTLVPASLEQEAIQASSERQYHTLYNQTFTPDGFAGDYLSGFFAQQHHDWDKANTYMQRSLDHDKSNTELLKRGIVLAIAAGEYDQAFERAKLLSTDNQDDSIGQLFMAVDAFKDGDQAHVDQLLADMSQGGIADFVKPLLITWNAAAQGNLDTSSLRKNTIHYMHGVLASHYLGQDEQTKNLLAESLAMSGFTVSDLERAGNIYIDLGEKDKAINIFEQLLKVVSSDQEIKTKLAKLKAGDDVEGYTQIQSAQDGVAMALFDMAKLFYQEGADDSAHIFTHMALSLDNDIVDAHILLADIAGRHDRYNDAIAYYNRIPSDHPSYIKAQREIANLLEDSGQTEKAITALDTLAKEHNDPTALIQIGDIYRHDENFPKAIEAYNRAAKNIGEDKIIPDYWYLHYVRGMAYERNGNWEFAEKDLKAALDFKPDHPYVLNYLGYAWADQNKNLDEATEMIKKAVSLEPEDGYITDSLGWVLYRTGSYKEAVVHLEKAVELLPYDPVINDHLGDAYWKVGRKLEAKFQWERAKNHIEENEELLAELENKLENGLVEKSSEIQQAKSEIDNDDETKDILRP